ncbi:class I SAM-dependent methyltransferase [Hymenobacter rigui]|uniref:DUF4942 domain-containing protein n=1 Tax=Hymenobacter rigui TaxID=334424 RepID=A0A428KGP4_9BACT|nr:DUF4942 domain-containing protein [Hymenobacter rigui]RSK45485.1 DUF4942 domain-containing protein [Hymenobacter rigui]
MLNPEFFPTPAAVIQRMLDPFFNPAPSGDDEQSSERYRRYNPAAAALRKLTILEPSAGSGAIVDELTAWLDREDYHSRSGKQNVYCCEADPELRAVLHDKGYKVIANDFLTYRGDHFFDLIVMNPPFSNGDRHLLKAWDVVAAGGDVVCLLNTETLANPYTETRQLLARLIEDYGTSEALGAVFAEAERPTNVGVSLVRLHKPAKADRLTFEFTSRGRRGPELNENLFANAVATRDVIGNMAAEYEGLKAQYAAYLQAREGMKFYAKSLLRSEYQDVLKLAEASLERGSLRTSYNNFADEMNQQIWGLVLDKVNIQKLMTADVRRNFAAFSKAQGYQEFTHEAVAELVALVLDNRETIMEQAVESVFDTFTKYHKENRLHVEGWVTNSQWKVNRKVILPYAVEENYSGKGFRVNWNRRDDYADIDRVMCYLAGEDYDACVGIDTALDRYGNQNANPNGVWTVYSRFFEIRAFKKGTVHLIFRDEYLWQEFNLRACAGKQWLPGPEMAAYRARQAKETTSPTHPLVHEEEPLAAPGTQLQLRLAA